MFLTAKRGVGVLSTWRRIPRGSGLTDQAEGYYIAQSHYSTIVAMKGCMFCFCFGESHSPRAAMVFA